jgi:uncharacterized protein YjbI with pentapeptide repeats
MLHPLEFLIGLQKISLMQFFLLTQLVKLHTIALRKDLQSEGTMSKQVIEMTQFTSTESYQLIKDEELLSIVISSQMLAGSCISKSTYRQVVFSDCLFYGTIFQGVTFDNCIFENCNFEFSHFRFCKFKNCNFTNCTWKASSSQNSFFEACDLPLRWEEFLVENNYLIGSDKEQRDEYTTDIYINLAVA